MAKFDWFRRESGEVIIFIVLLFIGLSVYVFKLSYDLIIMGVKGEFKILAEFSGITLYLFSISPGISLAVIIAVVWIMGVPRILHPSSFGSKKK